VVTPFAAAPVNRPRTILTAVPPEREARVYAKVTRRLIPFLFLFYIVAYLDRVNIGFAKLQMMKDLAWSDTIYGTGAGMFFIGYFLFEVPSNLILFRFGAREWMATIMAIWGLLSAAMMFVSSPGWFYLLRFSLGLAEAGFFPGIIFYLTFWYPARRRGQIVAIFMTAVAVSGVVGGPLSGWIMQALGGVAGLRGWQWLFVLEGLPSVLMGGLVLWILDDSIREAKWLDEDEKRLLEENIAADVRPSHHTSLGQVLADGRVWLCSLVLFLLIMGFYGIGFWLPQLIRNAGVASLVNVGLLSTIPYSAATAAMIWLGRRSDRENERHAHIAVAAWVGAAGMVLTGLWGGNLPLMMIALTLATSATFATIPVMVALPTEFLSGIAAAAGIGLIFSIGNLAGFFSPIVVGKIRDATHRMDWSLDVLAACLVLAGIILLAMRPRAKERACL
jgi:MFS family permease